MIPWFKRHPEYLRQEIDALASDPNYRQLHLARNNLLVSHGYILVRLDKIHRFPFLIVYPYMTPYALPHFFPLSRTLSNEEVEAISKLSPDAVFSAVKDSIKWYYDLRHQNSTGVLCILEWDNLDDGVKYYSVHTFLSRVRDWCRGTITNEFPPESQEVEYIGHFNRIDESISLVYNELFLQPPSLQGEAYAQIWFRSPAGDGNGTTKGSYINILLHEMKASGISMPIPHMPDCLMEKGIHNEQDLVEKQVIVEQMISDGELLKMYWFQIETEPPPFETLRNLITIIGEGNFDRGIRRMAPIVGSRFKSKPESILIAIRFPNRKKAYEFQLFRAKKTGQAAGLLNATPEDTIRNLVDDYAEVYAIRSTELSDKTYHLRNTGRADRELLLNTTVNLFGIGALGSELVDILNKAGVGTLSLFDNQLMRFDNSVRHLAGLNYAGRPKVSAVSSILYNHNPFNKVLAYIQDINAINFFDLTEPGSISISTIADDNVEAYLNERAVPVGKTIYYSRALRGGKAARIFRVIPGKDACFNCLELYRKEGSTFISVPEDPSLPTLKTECNNPIRPGSAADLKLISSLTARIILDELQKGPQETNQWVWSTEQVGRLQPFQLTAQTFPPHSDCVYCNPGKEVEVHLDAAVLSYIQSLAVENTKIETGGVLAGFKDSQGNFFITHASDPGPNAKRTPTGFSKDIAHCQAFLDRLYSESSRKTVYLGEWHSHPVPDNRPSDTDIKSLTDISEQPNYLIDNPAMIILSSEGSPAFTIHPAGKRFYTPKFYIES